MRPKKSILLYCANEITRNVLIFQMETWRYRVAYGELDQLVCMCAMEEFDLVLLLPGSMASSWRQFRRIAEKLERIQTGRYFAIRIYDTMKVLPESVAPAVHRIPTFPPSVEFLRVTMRTLMARKRGPRGSHRELLPPVFEPGEGKVMVA